MKPILFNTDMVQAILDGRKTMTRRVCKLDTANFDYDLKDKDYGPFLQNEYGDSINVKELAPYQPGDILYVRETWAREWSNEQDACHPFRDEGYNEEFASGEDFEFYGYVFKADTPDAKYPSDYPDDYEGAPTWRPSIHMPKEAARIFLEVTDVRVERLSSISEADAIKEGIRIGIGGMPYFSCVDAFRNLWDSIYAKRGYGWDANPYVWVYEFKRVEVTP